MLPGVYQDRSHAGRLLADALVGRGLDDALVLALPRGGVPVAAPAAARLGAPLDVVVARKLGAPHRPELGIGAVAEGGAEVVDADVVDRLAVDGDQLARIVARERRELQRRVEVYRDGRPLPDLGRRVVLVDDGLATGVTAEAALRGLATLGARRVVLAVPVGAPETVERLRSLAEEVVCLVTPEPLEAIGQWYTRFDQVTDDQVLHQLHASRRVVAPPTDRSSRR